MFHETDIAPHTRPQDELREAIGQHVADYLASGGVIVTEPIQSYKTVKARVREINAHPNMTARQKRRAINRCKGL